ncbi:hypothetical protein [Tumebacillus permanentifrigoris]|uniref:Uncharacterized protein n=1 Tax=Tumebacillus permanentifrigoris TaxID=378543 RepID=A0A316D4C4_9BACL|nr:hypothetical protein [Tumebacillus permanentifrigoris]PWK05282.1 hypothetical protein C7459_12431 [Tumebacillus permanentifrigoris]
MSGNESLFSVFDLVTDERLCETDKIALCEALSKAGIVTQEFERKCG